ncbi:unnamed protein product [Moneuplotes crassus]|uniref:RING-type domain-containing protein n=1 Tax=Euplotes crassus TaxID=5936 RepID=A0AAD1XD57_EUPCR|nr:unnamed protein product [Moneuplotes crassus]
MIQISRTLPKILVILVLTSLLVSCKPVMKHISNDDLKGDTVKSTYSIHALSRSKQGYGFHNIFIWVASYIQSALQMIPRIENLSLGNLEYYPFMSLKICCILFFVMAAVVIITERIVIYHFLKLKDRSLFYKSFKRNTLFTYFLLVFLADEGGFMCVPDLFIFFSHFGFYSTISAFREVFDLYTKKLLTIQANANNIPEHSRKIQKILEYYRTLKYVLISALGLSFIIFSEVGKLRLYNLYSPGIIALLEISLSHQKLYYKHKTSTSINEGIITFFTNYCFALNSLLMVIKVINCVKDTLLCLYQDAVPSPFSLVHMYYIMRNLKFFFSWINECEKFVVFHKNKILITNKFKLKIYDEKSGENMKEECGICLNYLDKARILPCNHQFHLICLLQLIKNGYKKCPVCRHLFAEEQRAEEENDNDEGALQNLNQMNFYGLEND